MYELIKRLSVKQIAFEQVPPFLLALTIAELFFKFHSFLMETGGFLLTWFLLDAALSMLRKRFNPPQTDIVS